MEKEKGLREMLETVFVQIINDLIMMTGKPVKLIWDPSISTASTDCVAQVRIAPWFFVKGHKDVGFGVAYHEGGHILHSPYGNRLLARAEKEGGKTRQHIMNIIMDRKDDMLSVESTPGFARYIRKRLLFLCTMVRFEKLKMNMNDTGLSDEELSRLLRGAKPDNVYEDFFFAAKWHKSPRFALTHKAMKHVTRKRLLRAGEEELLWIAKRVHEILGEPEDNKSSQDDFIAFMIVVGQIASGGLLPPAIMSMLANIVMNYVAKVRATGLNRLLSNLNNGVGCVYPGPISVGVKNRVKKVEVRKNSFNRDKYKELLGTVEHMLDRLRHELRILDSPSEYTLNAQDEGDELDFDEVASIATGLPGYYRTTVMERDIEAEIHLAIDSSLSMDGDKIYNAKRIVALFTEAILTLEPKLVGRVWSFDSCEICDFGAVSRESGFVNIEVRGGNSDTHLLSYVGEVLTRSQKRQKILILLCDDGPDDIRKASEVARQFTARGVMVIHIMIGVHGVPDMYPIELLYTSMEECLIGFGDLLTTLIKHLR